MSKFKKVFGGLFSAPKMPTYTPPPAPVVTSDNAVAQVELEAERKRRAAASGSSGNIVSSLSTSIEDLSATTKKSSLLGG